MTSLDHLLPEAGDVVRCADHARRIAIDPGGTAIRADRVVVVETGLPWPKPVFDHPTMREIDPLFKSAPRVTRLLACQPDDRSSTAIWVFDRLDGVGSSPATSSPATSSAATVTRERRFAVSSPDELLELSGCLAAETSGDQATSGAAQPTFDGVMAEPAVLVCTQGSHDVCCGSDGARLAMAAENLSLPPDAASPRVFRVSHTGGHRFAPTAMTLPDGRMWAYLGADMLSDILTGSGDPTHLAQYCRGWWGAERGPAQVVERAVFEQVGFALDHMRRTVTEVGPGSYVVATDDGVGEPVSWSVDVVLLREVPTISCRQPGGQPIKMAREYGANVKRR